MWRAILFIANKIILTLMIFTAAKRYRFDKDKANNGVLSVMIISYRKYINSFIFTLISSLFNIGLLIAY